MRHIFWGIVIFAMATSFVAIPVFAAGQEACEEYAHSAVHDFEVGTAPANAKKCRIKAEARWQPNFKNHYNWCLTAPAAWLRSERKARDDRLLACGARSTL
jgi:hypothetical protein